MMKPVGLTVEVQPVPDGDLDELVDLTRRLRAELLELDVMAVDELSQRVTPAGAKGLSAMAGWLLVRIGTIEGLRAIVSAMRSWVQRTDRTVEITLDGDVLKISRATVEQQEMIIDAWLARHTSLA